MRRVLCVIGVLSAALCGGAAVAAAAVDLVADSITVSATTVEAGAALTTTWSGRVGGTDAVSGPFTVGVYLSSDATLTTSDILLTRLNAAWATTPGSTFGQSGQALTIPAATVAGTYVLGVILDEGEEVAELSEANNVATVSPITVTGSGLANLVVTSCSVSAAVAAPGQVVNVSWHVANTGGAETAPFDFEVALGTDAALVSGHQVLYSGGAGAWQPGMSVAVVDFAVTLPEGLAGGSYFIGPRVDVLDTVIESSEADNACSRPLTVTGEPVTGVSRWLIPAAASSPGVGTSNWKSQIAVVNPTSAPRQATLHFVARGQAWPGVVLSGPHQLLPGQSLYLDDPLLPQNPTSGLLYVDLDDAGPLVTSRTYNLDPVAGTFGQGIPAVPFDGVAVPAELVLPMVHSAAGRYRTNLGLVQASAGSYSVEVVAYAPDGSFLATKSYTQTAAYRQITDVFSDMGIGSATVEGGWLRLRLAAGSPSYWTCYASVVDASTSDPTYVAPLAAGGE